MKCMFQSKTNASQYMCMWVDEPKAEHMVFLKCISSSSYFWTLYIVMHQRIPREVKPPDLLENWNSIKSQKHLYIMNPNGTMGVPHLILNTFLVPLC